MTEKDTSGSTSNKLSYVKPVLAVIAVLGLMGACTWINHQKGDVESPRAETETPVSRPTRGTKTSPPASPARPAAESAIAAPTKHSLTAPAKSDNDCSTGTGWAHIDVPGNRTLCSDDVGKVNLCFRDRNTGTWNSTLPANAEGDALRVQSRTKSPTGFRYSIIDENARCP